MAGTTADKLQGIIDAKADIASAITTKGGTVPTLFADYGDAIRDLPSGSTPVICGLNVTPTTSAQTITASGGTDGYSPVNVSAVTSSIDSNIQAGNIKSGTTILGVTGTYSGSAPALSGLVVVPSTSAQTITPTSGIDGFNQVNVNAVTSSIDQNIVSGNIKDGVTILGVTGTYEGGGGGDKFASLVDRSISGAITASDLSGATSIGSNAFNGCIYLGSITIPDSVTSIGDSAFGGCSGLVSVTIPDSVTSIGDSAFHFCSALTSVTFGSGLTSIGSNAFRNSALTSVTIPDNVTSIGGAAFRECSLLASVTIGSGVTSIENLTFAYCYSLTSVTIPDSVTSIKANVFDGCSGLTSVTFGSGLTSIGAYTFRNCTSCLLYDFRSATQVPTLSNVSAFGSTNANKKIVVPDALYDSWIAANNWNSSTNGIVGAVTKASDYNP